MSGHKTAVSPKRMKEDFEIIKQKIRIEDIANYLLGEDVRGMYKFPQERTASIKIYPKTQSFFDYGRGTGGDAIRLWSHVRQVDNWTAVNEIKILYGISDSLDKENIRQKIRQQEAQRQREKAKKELKKKLWVAEVDRLKEQAGLYEKILDLPHIKPLSYIWCYCKNQKQLAEYQLDVRCSVEE